MNFVIRKLAILSLLTTSAMAQATDRGPQPPLRAPGMVTGMTSVKATEKFNARAAAFNRFFAPDYNRKTQEF
jgi:hypothetical protein